MPRLSLWKDGKHTNDFKFFDNRIREMFTIGGVGLNVHKFLGTEAGSNDGSDLTQPNYINQSDKNIQDLLFLENRDRKYDRDIYNIRGHYTIQDIDYNLSQFGLFINNDTLYVTFHINDMIERLGRRIISGDVLELHHLRDYNPLDPDDQIPVALKKYYVVQEATRAAEGYSQTWWPHLWRCKIVPMVDSQEYKDILDQEYEDEDGNTIESPLKDFFSTYNTNIAINDAIVNQAENDVPKSGYDTTSLYTIPTKENGEPGVTFSENADSELVKADNIILTADYTYLTPKRGYLGYLVGDGIAPNGFPVTTQTYFPELPKEGEYVLRVDYYPNRLFRYNGKKWVVVEDSQRAQLTGAQNNTQRGGFVNNPNLTKTRSGQLIDERQALSQVLKAREDN